MAKCVGLTGGIGSGKSTVAKIFLSLGIPVFFADDVAKSCYGERPIQQQVINAFGSDLYKDGQLQSKILASRVFGHPDALQKLEAIIHPRVHELWTDFTRAHSGAKYIVRENAILIASNGHLTCDKIILVTAPLEVKIQRVMQRSQLTREQIEARIQHQWTDEQLTPFADWIVANDNQNSILKQVLLIHEELMQ
jgi:dephospho-CoA kinase